MLNIEWLQGKCRILEITTGVAPGFRELALFRSVSGTMKAIPSNGLTRFRNVSSRRNDRRVIEITVS
jgi:hypothetical protein